MEQEEIRDLTKEIEDTEHFTAAPFQLKQSTEDFAQLSQVELKRESDFKRVKEEDSLLSVSGRFNRRDSTNT